jgi:hypothetical protein
MPGLESFNFTTLSGIISGFVGFGQRYNGKTCLANITSMLSNDTNLVSQNPAFFFPDSTPDNPVLTLSGCIALCGSPWGPYPDDGPRLYEWIIPGLLLVANMHFSPIGKKRYLVIAQLLGNPVGCMWRLLYLVEDSIESAQLAHRIIRDREERPDGVVKHFRIQAEEISVIILAAARLVPSIDMHKLSDQLSAGLDIAASEAGETRCHTLREKGIVLRDQRSHDVRRTGFAVLIYILQVIALFVAAVGGSANPTGGKVAPAMLLVWLLPVVLLSNAIGDYGCWDTSRRILFNLLDLFSIDLDDCIIDRESSKNSTSTLFFNELACSGAVVHSDPSDLRRIEISIISVMPVALACAAAFTIDMTGPTWFSCRATASLCSLAWWLLSAAVTGIMLRVRGRYLWRLIWLKDIIFAIPILVFILLSAGGYFNSCFCTGGAIIHGNGARVVLNQSASWPFNNNKFYPAVVSTGIVLQLLIPVLAWRIQRQGFRTMWWKNPLAASILDQRYKAPVPEAQTQTGKVVDVTVAPVPSTASSLAGDDDSQGPIMVPQPIHLNS